MKAHYIITYCDGFADSAYQLTGCGQLGIPRLRCAHYSNFIFRPSTVGLRTIWWSRKNNSQTQSVNEQKSASFGS